MTAQDLKEINDLLEKREKVNESIKSIKDSLEVPKRDQCTIALPNIESGAWTKIYASWDDMKQLLVFHKQLLEKRALKYTEELKEKGYEE